MSFQAYLKTIKEKTGNGPAEFRVLAEQKSFTSNKFDSTERNMKECAKLEL